MAERTNPFTFLQQVRAEVSRVVWPTRRETAVSTLMVFVFAALAAVFFLLVDQALGWGVTALLGIGGRAELAMEKRWYIVHAYSNFEKKVAESIREKAQATGLADLFDEILVPTEKVVEVRRGRKVDAERKFFPGYVLVKMAMTDEAYHLIKNTPKVTGFLGADSRPMPISEREALHILQQVQEGVERPKPSISFDIGEQVRVSDGPFASFNGLVEEIDEERARLKVAVSIFGRATPVELEYGQVEKL